MPKTLNDKLEDLENEIKIMLMVQEPGSCCNRVKGAKITTRTDGTVEQSVFDEVACTQQKGGNSGSCCGGTDGRPSSNPESSRGGRMSCSNQDGRPKSYSTGKSRTEVTKQVCLCLPPTDVPPGCTCGPAISEPPPPKRCSCGSKKMLRNKGSGTDVDESGGDGKGPNEKGDATMLIKRLRARVIELEDLLGIAHVENSLMCQEFERKSNTDQEHLKNLRNEKDEFGNALEQERQHRKKAEKHAQQGIEHEKQKLAKRVRKIELNAVRSTKKIKSQTKQLVDAMHERDDHIRRLSSTTEKLADSIRDRESENRKLSDAHKEAVQNFMDLQVQNKKLTDVNQSLLKGSKDMQDRLQAEKNRVEKLQKHISESKDECKALSEEIERLKEKMKQILKGPKDMLALAKLQDKLREAREREQMYLEEAKFIEEKLKELEEDSEQKNKENCEELERCYREHKKLQAKLEEAYAALRASEEDCAKKLKKMEEMYMQQVNELIQKFEALQKDRDSLQKDFDELSDASIRDRQILQDLIERTQQQDVLIMAQQKAVEERDTQLDRFKQRVEEMQHIIVEQNNQVSALNQNIKEMVAKQEENLKQIEALSSDLQKEQAASLEKEKKLKENEAKINNLTNTIKEQQKQVSDLIKEASDAKAEMAKAKEQISKLEEDVQREKSEKEQMKQDCLAALEAAGINDVTLGVGGAGGAGGTGSGADGTGGVSTGAGKGDGTGTGTGKPANLLCCLEEKIMLLQRESQLQLDLVLKQKTQAVNAARFATQQLLETVDDFRGCLETHKDVEIILQKVLFDKQHPPRPSSKSSKRCTRKASRSPEGVRMQCVNPACITNRPGYSP